MEQPFRVFLKLFFTVSLVLFRPCRTAGCENEDYESAIGDPGMKRDGLRVAIEAWNQCNEVHEEAPHMGSPRQADCFDLDEHNCPTSHVKLVHKVKKKENKLGISDARAQGFKNTSVDQYAAWKELFLGSCWKNNGEPCNGDVTTDVTRYSEMIINPSTEAWCRPNDTSRCPPYHTFPNGTWVHRSDKEHFPYDAYHVYCSPGNAKHLEEPYNVCDPYSNPQPQEILQILPHPVWGDYGYPTKKGEGWIGDPRTWELDVGRLSQSLYFYQDPGTKPVKRHWPSVDLGTEIYVSGNEIAEWSVSDFNIIVPKKYY